MEHKHVRTAGMHCKRHTTIRTKASLLFEHTINQQLLSVIRTRSHLQTVNISVHFDGYIKERVSES